MDQTTQGVSAAPTVFTYCAEKQVRTIYHNNTAHFVAKDVCDVLEFTSKTDSALRALDDDEKLILTLSVSGQKRQMWMVNESGLYHLIFISRKPEAKKFRKWVTSEVLPALHRTGTYSMPNATASTKPDVGNTDTSIMNQLASQLDLIQSLSVNFWDYSVLARNGFVSWRKRKNQKCICTPSKDGQKRKESKALIRKHF